MHENLNKVFKTQIDPKKCISMTDKILPVLPSKISSQSEHDLNQRKDQL